VRKYWNSLLNVSTNTNRTALATDALMRRDIHFLKPRPTVLGRLQVSPLITTGTANIWLPDFCPQPSQISLNPSFIYCTTNRHAKPWFWVIEACLATPSGLWHRGQAKQTSCHFPFQPLSARERPISKNSGKAVQKSTCYAPVSCLNIRTTQTFPHCVIRAIVKLVFQSAPKHYLNVYKSSGPGSQRQAVLKAGHENRVYSLLQEHTAAYQWRWLRNKKREGEPWKKEKKTKTHERLWNMTAQQRGRLGRGRPYCNNLILQSLIVSCCCCSVCRAYVKHISPLSPGVRRCRTKTTAPRGQLSDDRCAQCLFPSFSSSTKTFDHFEKLGHAILSIVGESYF